MIFRSSERALRLPRKHPDRARPAGSGPAIRPISPKQRGTRRREVAVKLLSLRLGSAFVALLATFVLSAVAAEYPAPREGDWVARNFKFHTGEGMPELRLHYATIGDPAGEPVLILHGTTGSGSSMLTPAFAGELFGAGQPLDTARYFIVLPDALGAGKSARPSDGMRAQFPRYNYDDMVLAQYRLVTEGLGIRHLRLVLGNSMGGMHTWVWGVTYPDFMDALVPMASQPTEMSSRNWMLRRMLIDAVRKDPSWNNGNYTTQPPSLRIASVFFGIATSGGTLAYQAMAPTREQADRLVDAREAAPFTADANDFLYQFDAARDYNPAPGLERIRAAVLAINSADDERNPPETGLMEQALKRIRNARLLLIPASAETRGHGTTANAAFWKQQLQDFLNTVPQRAM
jgi:homoserine O-acetyltransferase